MLSVLACAFLLIGVFLTRRHIKLRRNIEVAKKTQLPFIVVPIYTGTPLYYFFYKFILPPFEFLPSTWTTPWLKYVNARLLERIKSDV